MEIPVRISKRPVEIIHQTQSQAVALAYSRSAADGPAQALEKIGNYVSWVSKDTDPYARERDDAVIRLAEEAGVEVGVRMGRILFDPDELVRKNGGKPTMSMTQTEKAAEKINGGKPDRLVEAPKSVPDPWEHDKMGLSDIEHQVADPSADLNAGHRGTKEKQYSQIMGLKNDFAVLTMQEIGIDPSLATTPHRGGETVALQALADFISDDEYIGTFEKPKTSPAAVEPQSTTLLFPHLHFGSFSIRKY